MDVRKVFFDLDVHAEEGVFVVFILAFIRTGSKNSSSEVVHVLLVDIAKSRGAHVDADTFLGLFSRSSVEVELHVVSLVLKNSLLGLLCEHLEGLTHAFVSLGASETHSKQLTHGSRASLTTR